MIKVFEKIGSQPVLSVFKREHTSNNNGEYRSKDGPGFNGNEGNILKPVSHSNTFVGFAVNMSLYFALPMNDKQDQNGLLQTPMRIINKRKNSTTAPGIT